MRELELLLLLVNKTMPSWMIAKKMHERNQQVVLRRFCGLSAEERRKVSFNDDGDTGAGVGLCTSSSSTSGAAPLSSVMTSAAGAQCFLHNCLPLIVVQSAMLEKGATQRQRRIVKNAVGTVPQVESLEVEESHGHRLDLDNHAKLLKQGKVSKHEGLFSVDLWCLRHQSGFRSWGWSDAFKSLGII